MMLNRILMIDSIIRQNETVLLQRSNQEVTNRNFTNIAKENDTLILN